MTVGGPGVEGSLQGRGGGSGVTAALFGSHSLSQPLEWRAERS